MELELIIESEKFKIQAKNNPDKTFHEANLVDLKDTRNERGILLSDWICHLSKKTWITYDILYNLAVLIKKEYPKINFNWYETFYDTEKTFYSKNKYPKPSGWGE